MGKSIHLDPNDRALGENDSSMLTIFMNIDRFAHFAMGVIVGVVVDEASVGDIAMRTYTLHRREPLLRAAYPLLETKSHKWTIDRDPKLFGYFNAVFIFLPVLLVVAEAEKVKSVKLVALFEQFLAVTECEVNAFI